MHIEDLSTPALVIDIDVLDANIGAMGRLHPGAALRPHVKAFKSTALARRLDAAGHHTFCAATPREILGLAEAGLGADLLLANEVVDPARLEALAACDARVTVAVDSTETIDAAANAGLREVLIDVDVGCVRCGCAPGDAGRLADHARSRGLVVRGVMGYEGQSMMAPDALRADQVAEAMGRLLAVHDEVGGEVVSGGGTGTCVENTFVTELQAGSFTLMDTDYAAQGLPFGLALGVWCTVVSVNRRGWAVADGGLKALGMDHGNPNVDGHEVVYFSDEHVTFVPDPDSGPLRVGDRVRVWPAHVDPTVAYHERFHVVRDGEVVDVWAIDLRGW